MKKHNQHLGLSLVETVITVGVLAILTAMVTPTINLYVDNRRVALEQRDLLKIREALQLFAQQYNRLPSSDPAQNRLCSATLTANTPWYGCLAKLTELSQKRIKEDAWGNDRVYLSYSHVENMSILPEGLEIQYASVHSKGPNFKAENKLKGGAVVNGIALKGREFADIKAFNWWASKPVAATALTQFQELQPGGDDMMLKFSDMEIKLEKFQETRTRMRALEAALRTYAARKKQEKLISAAGNATLMAKYERLLYYPYSFERVQATGDANRDTSAKNDFDAYDGASSDKTVENRDSTNAQRRERLNDMIALVRMLGLPDSFCCDALEKDVRSSSSGKDYTQDRPFFYSANPRPYIGGTCKTRAHKVPFTPPLISRDPIPCE